MRARLRLAAPAAAPAAAHGADAAPATAFTPDQLFFIAFAHSWASAIRPQQAVEFATNGPTSPRGRPHQRHTRQQPGFQQAFAIKGPGPMVKKDRCVIW